MANKKLNSLKKEFWDKLRLQCCTTGLKAFRIVLVNKKDIDAVVDSLFSERVSNSGKVIKSAKNALNALLDDAEHSSYEFTVNPGAVRELKNIINILEKK